MAQRKSWRGYGFGVLVLAAASCSPAEKVEAPGPRPPVSLPGRAGQVAIDPGKILPAGGSCALPSVGVSAAPIAAPNPMMSALSGPTVRATTPPPPISGGTLMATQDGTLLVAADPERDQLYFVDLKTNKLLHVRPLLAGDEPGRLVEDAQGRIHVALRGGRAIATLTREAQSPITRREVCAVPRGLAYDAAHNQLHVACAEGSLVSLGAAPDAEVTRRLDVGSDARDVIVRGDHLFVSHFRSAQLDELGPDGERMQRMQPATFTRDESVLRALTADGKPADVNGCNAAVVESVTQKVDNTPNVAWRAIDVPNRGVAMLHQRARMGEVQITQGGYGVGSGCGSGIVQSALSVGLDRSDTLSADLGALTLAVDVAASPNGELLAVVAPGSFSIGQQLMVLTLSELSRVSSQSTGARDAAAVPLPAATPLPSGSAANVAPVVPNAPPCVFPTQSLPEPTAQATAVTFAGADLLAVQQREPAGITLYDLRSVTQLTHIDLQQASTEDTGHALFHLRAGAGVACASCHPEAGDDGHVWTFKDIGARRTQALRGGILGTEPFHWNGDMRSFSTLMSEVFVRRMSGFEPRTDQADALASWIDKQPALHADASDPAAAARGKQLFGSEAVGCADCHGGKLGTNNENKDVGTGAELQVPALKGLRFRTPLMHDGCAPTIASRFSDAKCGGGDDHGQVSQLNRAQLADLTAYLETL